MSLGVGERQEIIKFLVGLESLGGEIVQSLDGPGVLGLEQLRYRQARAACSAYRAVCAPEDFLVLGSGGIPRGEVVIDLVFVLPAPFPLCPRS